MALAVRSTLSLPVSRMHRPLLQPRPPLASVIFTGQVIGQRRPLSPPTVVPSEVLLLLVTAPPVSLSFRQSSGAVNGVLVRPLPLFLAAGLFSFVESRPASLFSLED